jgi:hypothetical protein
MVALLFWLSGRPRYGLAFGLTSAFMGWLLTKLMRWWRVPVDYALAVTPRLVLQGDRTATTILILAGGLFTAPGLVLVTMLQSVSAVISYPVQTALLSLGLGLAGGFVFLFPMAIGLTAWGWFVIARVPSCLSSATLELDGFP